MNLREFNKYMIKNTLLYYRTKNQYDNNLSQINTNLAIAFVEDEGAIYTHGHKFGGSSTVEDGSITASKIAPKAVTSSKLADNISLDGSLQAKGLISYNDDGEIILNAVGKAPITSKYGFRKEGKTNNDVLLAGGDAKPLKTINNISLLGEGNIDVTGGGALVLSDWTETDLDDPAYILHKPGIDLAPTNNSDNLISSKAVYNAFNGGPFIEKGTGAAENRVEIEIDWQNSEELCTKVGDAYIDEHDVLQVLISVDPRMFVPKDNLVDNYYWSSPYEINAGDTITIDSDNAVSMMYYEYPKDKTPIYIPVSGSTMPITHDTYTVVNDNAYVRIGLSSAGNYSYTITRYKDASLLPSNDKKYNPTEFSGLGKVYLKKNIVEVGGVEKNILTQSAFYKEGTQTPNTDTVFVVQHDFTIDGGSENIELNFSSSNVSGVMTLEKAELNAATAAYNANPTSENLTRKQRAEDAYESIGSQDYYYWTTYTIPARHCLYLTGRAFLLNDSKNAIIATENNRGIIFAPTNESLTVYIGNLEGRYSYVRNGYITVPANCVLEFEGGSLDNGTIACDYTGIEAYNTQIFGSSLSVTGSSSVTEVYPEWFGAKGDGVTDDTTSIQKSINFCEEIGGGTTVFGTKKYRLSSITIGTRTNLRGQGQGATILYSDTASNFETGGIIVYPINVGISVISDMTILGSAYDEPQNGNFYKQNGINVIPKSETGSSPEAGAYYINEHRKSIQTKQSYKDAIIKNVYIGRCHYGITCTFEAYRITISDCDIKFCDYGVVFKTTDCTLRNLYVERCKYDGLIVGSSNNKVSDIKSIWNGQEDPLHCYGIKIGGRRNAVSNCEAQDNYCSGIRVSGDSHTLTNIISNGNAIALGEEIDAVEDIDGSGLVEWDLYTVNTCFNNCIATNYTKDFNRGQPKYPIKYSASHPQTLGTDIKIYGYNLMTLGKHPIYPDTPIRNTHSLNIIEENYNSVKGYKLPDERVKLDIPLKENLDSLNMAVICEFIPEEVVEEEIVFNLFEFYRLYIRPFDSETELVNGGKRLQVFPAFGNRYPGLDSFKLENIDLNKPVRVFMRANYIKTQDDVAQIEAFACLWYYSTYHNCYTYVLSRTNTTYDLHEEGGIIYGGFRDYKAGTLGFRRGLSYLNYAGSTENTVYLRKLIATYDSCIPDTVSYPCYPLYNLNPEFSFDYLTLRTDRRNQYSGPTAKRPQYVSPGNIYYDETINLPVCFIRDKWNLFGVIPLGNVTPEESGQQIINNTINADNLQPGTVVAYTAGDDYKDTYHYPFGYCYVLTLSIVPNSERYCVQLAFPRSDNDQVAFTINDTEKVIKYRTKVNDSWSNWYPNTE